MDIKLKTLIIKIKPEYLIVASLAIIYFVFGLLKVAGMSPVEKLVIEVNKWFGEDKFFILGLIEMGLAVGLIIPKIRFIFAVLIFLHLISVSILTLFFPAFLFSNETGLTIEGQFVLKNLVLLSAAYYLIWKKVSKND